MRSTSRPADDAEALDAEPVEQREQLVGVAEQGAPDHRRPAAVDGDQPDAEPGGDAVVGMAREPGVPAAVQVDDRRAAGIADVVDRQRGVTTRVALMPSARWFASEHQSEYRPGASLSERSVYFPDATVPMPAMCRDPRRCNLRSWASCP